MTSQALAKQPVVYRWLVFAVLALAYLLVYFHRTSPAVVALDMMADLQVGAAATGLLASAYFYPYALMQIPAGLLSDSWGPRKTITVFFALAGLGSILFGLAGSLSTAIAARVLVGLGVAMLFVPTMKVLTHWFKREEFARAMGILMAVGGAGVFAAAGPLAWLSKTIGWRGSFMAIGAVTLVLAAVVWLVVRNTPAELGYASPDQMAADQPEKEAIGMWQGMKMVLSNRHFWPLAIWFFATPGGVFFSFGGLWSGPYLMQVYGMDKTQAGGIMGMLAVGMIVGSPIMSWVSDKVLVSRKKLILITSSCTVLLMLPLVLATGIMPTPLLYVWFFLLGVCTSAVVVVAFTSAKELFPVAIAGTATGLVNLPPFVGGAVMQPVLGWLLELQAPEATIYSAQVYGRAFILYLVLSLISLVAAFFLKDTLRRSA
jgi:sugar phosphate permease